MKTMNNKRKKYENNVLVKIINNKPGNKRLILFSIKLLKE